MKDPITRLPEAWLIDDLLANCMLLAGTSLMQDSQRLGQILPPANGILFTTAMNLDNTASVLRSSFIQRLQTAHGPTATQMRQQSRIDGINYPYKEGYSSSFISYSVEERIAYCTPKRFPTDWSLLDLATLQSTFVPYFNGLYRHSENQYLLVMRPRPSLSSWAEPSHLEDSGDFDWVKACSSLRLNASSRNVELRLVLRQKNGSAVFLRLSLYESTWIQHHDTVVYDALEDAVYPGTLKHIDAEAVRVALFNLVIAAGYPADTITLQPSKEAEQAALQEAQDILVAAYQESPYQDSGGAPYRYDPRYTETMDTDGNITWTLKYRYLVDSSMIVFEGTDKDVPQTGIRGQGSNASTVLIDPLTLPTLMQAWKSARDAYLKEILESR